MLRSFRIVALIGILAISHLAFAAEPKKGDIGVLEFGTNIKQVKVVDASNSHRLKVKDLATGAESEEGAIFIHFPDAGYELLTAKTPVKVGEKLKAYWGRTWTDVKVIKSAGDKVKITWDEYPGFPPDDKLKILLSRRKTAKKSEDKAAGNEAIAALPSRTWTDKSGKHKIEAKYAGLADDKVQLITKDGKPLSLALDKLSAADQEVARKLAKDHPPAEENPFEMAANGELSGEDSAATEAETTEEAEPELKIVAADWSEAFEISPRNAGPLQVPAAALVPPTLKLVDRSIALGEPSNEHFEQARDVLASPDLRHMIAVFDLGRPGVTEPYRFNLCDMEKGKMLGTVNLPGKYLPIAFSGVQQRVLTFTEGAHRAQPHVDLWELNPTDFSLMHVVQWNPLEGATHGFPPTVRSAQWLGDDYALLSDSTGKFTLWQCSKAKAIYFGKQATATFDPQFTPDGKSFFAIMGGTLAMFDALTAKAQGQIDLNYTAASYFSVSPDGKRLATFSMQQSIVVIELSSNRVIQEVVLPPAQSGVGSLAWADNEYILVGSSRLVDPALGIVAWKYSLPSSAGRTNGLFAHGGLFWGIKSESGMRPSLVAAKIPHPGVKTTLAELEPAKLIVFPSGTKIRLDLKLPQMTPQDVQKITESFTRELTEAGATVAPDGEMVLTCTHTKGEPKAIAYGERRGFRSDITAQAVFCSNSYSFELKDGAKLLWNAATATGAPGYLSVPAGQTVETYMSGLSQPNAEFFLNQKFPKGMRRPGNYNGAYGATSL